MKIYDVLIDYEFVKSFDLSSLKESLILPIKKDGIYIDTFVCEESNSNIFNETCIFREKKISKDEILFFLIDIDIRYKLFILSKKALRSENLNSNIISEFMNILIQNAIASRSSDIHMETFENSSVIRFRIDGIMKIFYVFQKEFANVISSHIKMLSNLDITNSRIPMDGSFSLYLDDKKYDFRVSTMPTINGESIVIRVLDNQNILKKIDSLGFSSHILTAIEDIKKLTQGLVLITGPTGSGKSTTLYSLIKEINKEDKKIVTIEDPVEYKLQQVQQIEINDPIGLSFDTVLRSVLRQDPDVILIGEIRDELSLNIALQASLTGHLVLASVHANNSIQTLNRLYDLKADNYLLSATLKYIFSQRLVLNICTNCKKQGCKKCNYKGFYGRSCIAEALKVDEDISRMISKEESIIEYLDEIKFKTILDDGKEKVASNITTIEEVYKVIEKI